MLVFTFWCWTNFQDISAKTWNTVLRPVLADTGGHAIFIGTPKAYNQLYIVYKKGQISELVKSRQWEAGSSQPLPRHLFQYQSLKPHVQTWTKSFRQEFEASFENMSGRVYYPFDRREHTGDYPFNPDLPIWVGYGFQH